MIHNRTYMLLGVAVLTGAIGIGCGKGDATSGAGGSTSTGVTTATGATGATGTGTGGNSTSAGGAGSTGSDTTSTSTGAGGGGSSGTDCKTYAQISCDQLQMCAPALFTVAWESEAICLAESEKQCKESTSLPGATGVVNAAQCAQAVTASCDAFFSFTSNPPAACQSKPGTLKDMDPCVSSSQCGGGLYCYIPTANAPGCPGYCSAPAAIGDSCAADIECDSPTSGVRCVKQFDTDPTGTVKGLLACQKVAFGGAGADCYPGSEKQCGGGFACSTSTRKCVALLPENADCSGAAAQCDSRLGLTCQMNANNAKVCTLPTVVNVGAQCGVVNKVPQICSAYAICDNAATPKCELRVKEGQACTAAPDNCYPGLTCKAGKCAQPDPVTCN